MIDFVSIDVEADGPIPGRNSMLSFGAAAFCLGDRNPQATFEANLELLPEAIPDLGTMNWWKSQPEAWKAARENTRQAEVVMPEFVAWYRQLPGNPPLAGFPISYDQMWLHWYVVNFVGEDPMGFSGIDIKTLAMAFSRLPYRQASKRNLPKTWFENVPTHDHRALGDAIGQGILLINMLNQR